MKKQLFVLIVLFLLLFNNIRASYAQSAVSECVSTDVGNPTEEKPEHPANCKDVTASGDDGKFIPVTAPDPPFNVQQGIYTEFGIQMEGYDREHLIWAWEKLWEISNTKFKQLTKGAHIVKSAGGYSQQVGCRNETSVYLRSNTSEAGFKYILTHELGHFIMNCSTQEDSKRIAHRNALEAEGAVSFYGQYADVCLGGRPFSEDYADMIAYYLNPEAGIQSISKCDGRPSLNSLIVTDPPNPFFGLTPPKSAHLEVVKQILL